MNGRARAPAPGDRRAAVLALRLSALLAGGLAPSAAWSLLAAADPDDAVAPAAARAAAGGRDVAAAIAAAAPGSAAWGAIAAAWEVADRSGAPLAACLARIAAATAALGDVERERAVALAGPRATMRLVAALPLVGIGMSLALGLVRWDVLLGPFGLACLAVGAVLIAAAVRWNGALLAAARRGDAAPGLLAELVAIGLAGGASVASASTAARAALDRYTPVPARRGRRDRRRGSGEGEGEVAQALALAESAGVPAARLLEAEAGRARLDALAEARERAAALGVRLMLPLAVCLLPAFLVTAVVPMIAGLLLTTLQPW